MPKFYLIILMYMYVTEHGCFVFMQKVCRKNICDHGCDEKAGVSESRPLTINTIINRTCNLCELVCLSHLEPVKDRGWFSLPGFLLSLDFQIPGHFQDFP